MHIYILLRDYTHVHTHDSTYQTYQTKCYSKQAEKPEVVVCHNIIEIYYNTYGHLKTIIKQLDKIR